MAKLDCNIPLSARACRVCVVGRNITLLRNQANMNKVMFLTILPLRYPYFRAFFIIIFVLGLFFPICVSLHGEFVMFLHLSEYLPIFHNLLCMIWISVNCNEALHNNFAEDNQY
jgi:hypothetical protein